MEPEVLRSLWRESATGRYPEPTESNPRLQALFKTHFNIILPRNIIFNDETKIDIQLTPQIVS
jgi:hypothetical protein